MRRNAPCPCGSGAQYRRCCRPLHQGTDAPTPEALMRSRFSAYAIGLAAYVVETTDPDGAHWRDDRREWLADIDAFSRGTRFLALEILAAGADGDAGWVTFHATLEQGGQDASFTERSTFRRVQGRWRYTAGTPQSEGDPAGDSQ